MKFGTLEVMLDRLAGESQIIAKKNGTIVMNQKVPLEMLDLLLRRKVVQPSMLKGKTKEAYRKLHTLSGKGMDNLDRQIILVTTPEQALDRLEVLRGSQLAGNDSKRIRKDIDFLKQYLLKQGVATQDELDDL